MDSFQRTPKSEKSDDFPFERKPMVRWFDPQQLVGTGIKAMLSSIFGAYSDKREIQAALTLSEKPERNFHDYSEQPEIGVDFVADLGDGWNSTYTIALLLAQSSLQVSGLESLLPRGKLLVMGGDQVYPTARREEYRDRFEGPYRSALPRFGDQEAAPHLYAIPGNHDWYDGLTSFTRLFCQQRWIGGWKTQQTRSYFAIKLPHRWWLWGIDIQLEADIDKPQLDYFLRIARSEGFAGSKIILCTGQPSWVKTITEGPESYQNLGHLEKAVIREHGGVPVLTLTGDLHHYCRYESADGKQQKITAGGGGAYLFGTHRLPETLELDEDVRDEKPPTQYHRKTTFPDAKKSTWLSLGAIAFPYTNWKFSLLLGCFYLLNAWIIQTGSKQFGQTFLGQISVLTGTQDFPKVLLKLVHVWAHSPASVVFTFVLFGMLIAFCEGRKRRKLLIGAGHGLCHILLMLFLMWIFSTRNLELFRSTYESAHPTLDRASITELVFQDGWQMLLFSAEMILLGSISAGFLFGLYLVVCDFCLAFHENETFSSQGIQDYKNFLRLQIDQTGTLKFHAIGVPSVCKKWRFCSDAKGAEPRFKPNDRGRESIQEYACLIETVTVENEHRHG